MSPSRTLNPETTATSPGSPNPLGSNRVSAGGTTSAVEWVSLTPGGGYPIPAPTFTVLMSRGQTTTAPRNSTFGEVRAWTALIRIDEPGCLIPTLTWKLGLAGVTSVPRYVVVGRASLKPF